ncbi:Hypothetical_protein [Hexamita inflata]|uniref:Hypothetical_protein n=1 Tax=Hexamita inflata TaxID=28002 RepID=A0AA86VMB1_9EUKA|nr:Hypothetical protein HINF_LOCUS58368 [Hexamita inflata]
MTLQHSYNTTEIYKKLQAEQLKNFELEQKLISQANETNDYKLHVKQLEDQIQMLQSTNVLDDRPKMVNSHKSQKYAIIQQLETLGEIDRDDIEQQQKIDSLQNSINNLLFDSGIDDAFKSQPDYLFKQLNLKDSQLVSIKQENENLKNKISRIEQKNQELSTKDLNLQKSLLLNSQIQFQQTTQSLLEADPQVQKIAQLSQRITEQDEIIVQQKALLEKSRVNSKNQLIQQLQENLTEQEELYNTVSIENQELKNKIQILQDKLSKSEQQASQTTKNCDQLQSQLENCLQDNSKLQVQLKEQNDNYQLLKTDLQNLKQRLLEFESVKKQLFDSQNSNTKEQIDILEQKLQTQKAELTQVKQKYFQLLTEQKQFKSAQQELKDVKLSEQILKQQLQEQTENSERTIANQSEEIQFLNGQLELSRIREETPKNYVPLQQFQNLNIEIMNLKQELQEYMIQTEQNKQIQSELKTLQLRFIKLQRENENLSKQSLRIPEETVNGSIFDYLKKIAIKDFQEQNNSEITKDNTQELKDEIKKLKIQRKQLADYINELRKEEAEENVADEFLNDFQDILQKSKEETEQIQLNQLNEAGEEKEEGDADLDFLDDDE